VRRFLLVIAGLLLTGMILEMWFINHTQEAIQWVPFILCGVGLVAVGAARLRPQRPTALCSAYKLTPFAINCRSADNHHYEPDYSDRRR